MFNYIIAKQKGKQVLNKKGYFLCESFYSEDLSGAAVYDSDYCLVMTAKFESGVFEFFNNSRNDVFCFDEIIKELFKIKIKQ